MTNQTETQEQEILKMDKQEGKKKGQTKNFSALDEAKNRMSGKTENLRHPKAGKGL